MKHQKHQQDEVREEQKNPAAGQGENPESPTAEAQAAPEQDAQAELARQKDAYLRLYAEFDNNKKRSAREKTDWIKYASSELLTALLPVVDDFERGLAAEEKEHPGSSETEGFRLIYNKLMETLRQKGLETIPVEKGDALDVDFHDAIARIPVTDEALKGRIVDVTQKGYKINGRVIRYAKVVVGE